ncbi:MAG TPA: DinB family protein [Pedobacter sp.]|uniref:DinB family protein n=1 Tax=Pedobacter sp. TaxID=1411316 RepID=UPI002C7A297C|nr:DinB family protein [Pedobacter sp.]HMI02623.1 DinB family protein [Pedobacter sp.]
MISATLERLEYLCAIIPPLLAGIDEQILSLKPIANKWSRKEIIGHLIDSAANNHQRFVRGQFEDNPSIAYDQNRWNEFNFYQQIDSQQLITFWEIYNRQLAALIKCIPGENLQRTCLVGAQLLTLDFLINDYVKHLEHHLHQIVDY